MDLDLAHLSNPMSTIDRLFLDIRVPEGIENDDMRRRNQVQTRVARFERHQHDATARVIGKVKYGRVTVHRLHGPIVPTVSPAATRNRHLEKVEQRGELAEDDYLLVVWGVVDCVEDLKGLLDLGTGDPSLFKTTQVLALGLDIFGRVLFELCEGLFVFFGGHLPLLLAGGARGAILISVVVDNKAREGSVAFVVIVIIVIVVTFLIIVRGGGIDGLRFFSPIGFAVMDLFEREMIGNLLGVNLAATVGTLDFNRTVVALPHRNGGIGNARETLSTGAVAAREENDRVLDCIDTDRAFHVVVVPQTDYHLIAEILSVSDEIQLVRVCVEFHTEISDQMRVTAGLTKSE